MALPLLKPALYQAGNEQAGDGDRATLNGGRCDCGYVFFPMQTFGCEQCGGSGAALRAFSLSGRGRLLASSLVHMHADPKRVAPFVVGTVVLDEGPVVRTLLTAISEPVVDVETRVTAVLVPVKAGDEGIDYLDLRFRVDGVTA